MLLPDARCGSSLLVDPVLARLPRLRHGFTARALGDAARDGAGVIGRAVDEPGWTIHAVRQVHGAEIVGAGEATREPGAGVPGDALVTDEPGALLTVRTADCVPALLAAIDGGVRAVAAVHAGWRGVVAGVAPRAVRALFDLAPRARLVAAVGPCLGACCFEIGAEVADQLDALGLIPCARPEGRITADLGALVRAQLVASGAAVPDPASPACTRCHPELFWSHRRGDDGRMAAFIGFRAS